MVALLKHCCSDDEFTFSTQLDFSYFFKECRRHYSSSSSYSLQFLYFPSYFLSFSGFVINTHPSVTFDFTEGRALIMENVEKSYNSLIGSGYNLYKSFISEPFNQLRFCSAVNTEIFNAYNSFLEKINTHIKDTYISFLSSLDNYPAPPPIPPHLWKFGADVFDVYLLPTINSMPKYNYQVLYDLKFRVNVDNYGAITSIEVLNFSLVSETDNLGG